MSGEKPWIGVLALQGAFAEHESMLREMGADCREIRNKQDLTENMAGLILPGGESSVQGKLLRDTGLYDPLRRRIESGMPVLATCAGLILLAREISNDDRRGFSTLPVRVKRNAYGRQLGSFTAFDDFAGEGPVAMRFIRAPYIESVLDDRVHILSRHEGKITGVRYRNQLALAFHPELGNDSRIHRRFLEMVRCAG